MQCILTALKAESLPLIQYLDLKREIKFNFPVFSRNDIYLIGTGVGKRNISKRIGIFYDTVRGLDIQFINIGIAGGKKNISKVGQIYLINKIIDDSLGRSFYPDILIHHSFDEKSLTTVDKTITSGGSKYDTLIDMEASEIFRVCSKIVPIHNLMFLKVVSDYLNFDKFDLNQHTISSLLIPKITIIKSILDKFKKLRELHPIILKNKDQKWIKQVADTLSLTQTQCINLFRISKGFRLKNPDLSFPRINLLKPVSKFERNKIFKNICEKLTT